MYYQCNDSHHTIMYMKDILAVKHREEEIIIYTINSEPVFLYYEDARGLLKDIHNIQEILLEVIEIPDEVPPL